MAIVIFFFIGTLIDLLRARVEKTSQVYRGAPAARRAAKRSPIGIMGKKRKLMKDFPYGHHG